MQINKEERRKHYIKMIHVYLSLVHWNDPEMKEELIYHHFGKNCLTELTFTEILKFSGWLKDQYKTMTNRSKKSIIHHMCLMGYVTPLTESPDYERIDNFIINIGSRNPKKKQLNFLSVAEMNGVCTQVLEMYKNEIRRGVKR